MSDTPTNPSFQDIQLWIVEWSELQQCFHISQPVTRQPFRGDPSKNDWETIGIFDTSEEAQALTSRLYDAIDAHMETVPDAVKAPDHGSREGGKVVHMRLTELVPSFHEVELQPGERARQSLIGTGMILSK